MLNLLFKSTSPLMGWFILMEILGAACLGAYWFAVWRHGMRPWNHVGLGTVVTTLFIISNCLLARHRRWALAGLVVCWLLMTLLLMPTLQ